MYARGMTPLKGWALMSKFIAAVFTCACAFVITSMALWPAELAAQVSSQAEPNLVTESYMIQSRDPGIQLYVRNKRPEGMTQFSGEKTLLYVHGTTQAASSTFDLPLDGLSWME